MACTSSVDVAIIANALLGGGFCMSQEEADLLADVVLGDLETGQDDADGDSGREENDCADAVAGVLASSLIENLDITREQADVLTQTILTTAGLINADENDNNESISSEDERCHEEEFDGDYWDDGVDDDELLGEGECELCDRYIKLTRHHLIPRSTWPRMQKILFRAAEFKSRDQREKALEKLGSGLEDRYDMLELERSAIKLILQTTCDICRQCHSFVHKTHPNLELAHHHNTIDKLLADEQLYQFCKWANKQRPKGHGARQSKSR